MATNPSILCLQDLPSPQGSNIIKLIPTDKSGKPSSQSSDSQTVLAELVAMVQLLTMVMSEISQVSSKEQQINNDLAQLNVAGANNQIQQAQKTQKALEASQHESFWHKALNVFLKYVLPVLIIVVTTIVLGPVAGAFAAGVFLLTTNIPGVGSSVMGLAAKGIAESLGKDFGWSPATIEAVEGGLNLAFAVILAVAGGVGAAEGTAFAVADTAAQVTEDTVSVTSEVVSDTTSEVASEVVSDTTSTVTNVAENGANTAEKSAETAAKAAKFAGNAGKVIGIGAFASQAANSNCFYDIIYGSWVSTNPNEKDKAAEWAGYISAAINVIIGIIAVVMGGGAIANSLEDASTFSSLAQRLGANSTSLLSGLNNATRAATMVNAGMSGYNAYVSQEVAGLQANMTKIMGYLQELLGTGSFIGKNSNLVNSNLKANLESIQTLLQGISDSGTTGKAEAQAMIKINQQA
jgi:hypothetical protein